MNNLKEFNDSYIKKTKAYFKRQDQIIKKIKELKIKSNRMKHPVFDKILCPIIEIIKEKLGAKYTGVMGPFGMGSEISVYWYKNNPDKKEFQHNNILGSLTFTSDGQGWAVKDYSQELNRFPKNSIGAVNGGNFADIPIDETMDIDWLLKFVGNEVKI